MKKGSIQSLDNRRRNKGASIAGFLILALIYGVLSVFLLRTTRSDTVVMIMGEPTPVRIFTGAFSSMANCCLLMFVVFYGRFGFILALTVLLCQFPSILMGIFLGHNTMSIPGLFTNSFAIVVAVLIYLNDVNIRKYQNRLRTHAVTDDLTSIPNRFAFADVMDRFIGQKKPFAVVTVNLNNFKGINNAMGSQTGNEVLKEISQRLKKASEEGPTESEEFVARQGGDEFAILIRSYLNERELVQTIQYYKDLLEEKMTIDDCDYFITTSVGYAVYPTDAGDADTLLAHANIAMVEAKRATGGAQICRYTPGLVNVERAVDVERKIRTALETDSVFFHLQPQYDVSHNLVGFEALARMKDENGDYISPGDFIPIAEKAGLVDQIDTVVFRKAALFFGQLIRKTQTDITLSVNVSVKHLMKNDYLEEVRQILAQSGVPASQIEIEITESIMIDSVEKALQCINEIKKMGIKIAIDDFGTGYSSLSYLNSFPADVLKIDKSFIDKMNTSDSSKQYVAAIISIGHIMNFKVISEGVEEDSQLDTLRGIGCDYIQGFIWGRPMPPEEVEKMA